jgi:4-hydroxybenzoate polyprenyltransferase
MQQKFALVLAGVAVLLSYQLLREQFAFLNSFLAGALYGFVTVGALFLLLSRKSAAADAKPR